MAAPNLVNVTTILGKTTGAALDTTTTTSLLANSASSGKVYKVNSIIVANVDGTSAADVTVSFYNGSTDFHLAKTVTVPADSTLIVLGKDSPIYLEENHSIRGGASANSDLEIVISYEDLTDD
tara:strand:+ start:1251 stop:1619 length:369 start_codon:yes stop_codon:yes gene_type:complete